MRGDEVTVRTRIVSLLAPLLVLSAVPANSQSDAGPLQALRRLDVRVLSVGTRLATANLAICRQHEWHAGLLVHDLSQYGRGQQPAAAAAFGLGAAAGVLALAEGGAAARAGVRTDDSVLAADGRPLPRPAAGAAGDFTPTARIIGALEAAFSDGVAELTVRRAATLRQIRIAADRGCASRFQVVPSTRLEAKADGRTVQLTSAMVEFARGDNELAAFLGHELAHNILRHRDRLNAAGVSRGIFAPLGRNGRLFRRTELEADRLAVHLMARAGYDPRAAVRLWTRQSSSDGRLFAGTHPDWGDRIAALQTEIDRIEAARRRGEQAVPPLPDGPL